MKNGNKIIFIFTFILISFIFTSISLNADTGPKPFLDIEVTDLDESDYYVGLLMKNDYYGPNRKFDENIQKDDYNNEYYDILMLINSKLKKDETYYLSELINKYEKVTSLNFHVGYYPPPDFKLYIYDISNDEIYFSDAYETYAFSSYYQCQFNSNLELNKTNEITLEKDYNYGKEILLFIIRLIITIGIEVGLAFIFRFDKKSIIIILVANICTQLLLNIGLNVFTYINGKNLWLGIPLLFFSEIIVFGIEMVVYKLYCFRKNNSKRFIILYTFIANIITLALSFLLWFI